MTARTPRLTSSPPIEHPGIVLIVVGAANPLGRSKAKSSVEQLVAERDRSLPSMREHQGISVPAQTGHAGAPISRACDLAPIGRELERRIEWTPRHDDRELATKVWLSMFDAHATTLDDTSDGGAECTRLPVENVFTGEVRFRIDHGRHHGWVNVTMELGLIG